MLGYDTSGDGRLDAFDTNQVCRAAAQTPAVCELGDACTSGAYERGAGGQDGRMDTRAGAYDTTGDGRIDRCHISRPSVWCGGGNAADSGGGSYAGPGGTTSASLGATASGPGNPAPLAPATLQRQYEGSGGQPQGVGAFVRGCAPPGRPPPTLPPPPNTAPYYPPTLSPEPARRR